MYLVDLLAVGLGNEHRGGLLEGSDVARDGFHGQARDYSEEMHHSQIQGFLWAKINPRRRWVG